MISDFRFRISDFGFVQFTGPCGSRRCSLRFDCCCRSAQRPVQRSEMNSRRAFPELCRRRSLRLSKGGLPRNGLVHLIHPSAHKHQTQHCGPNGLFVALPSIEFAAQPHADEDERQQLEGHAAVTYVIVGGLRHWLRVSPRAAHS